MPIRFQLTRDPKHLAQYYKIRQFCFRNDLSLLSFDGSEDAYDRDGWIMVGLKDDQCVAGARISGSDGNMPLPLEHEGLDLHVLFPQLQQQTQYCQWTRLAIMPNHRTPEMLRDTCQAIIELAAQQGYRYAFNVAGRNRARLYKRLHSNLGYDYRIMDQISVPEEPGFQGLPHLLSVTDLSGYGSGCNNHRLTA